MHSNSSFLSNLRYWSFHVSLNAAPSFIMALDLTHQSRETRITGMVAGVFVFIVGYTTLTSSPWFQRKIRGGPFEKALKLATRIRAWIAAIGGLGALAVVNGINLSFVSYLWVVDFFAGLLASGIVQAFGKLGTIRALRASLIGDVPELRAKSWWLGDMNSTIPTFLTTVTEGFLLSIFLFVLASVICFIAGRKNRC
jgi:hypothetical protein